MARLWRGELPAFAPPGLRLWLAQLAGTDPFGSPLGSDTTTGCTWWDDAAARAAAVGEAIEWYAGSLVPADLEIASAAQLRARGAAHVDPRELVLYSAAQLATPDFPFVPFTDDLPVRWAPGRSLVDGRPRLVPASVVYLGYGTGPTRGEPFTNLPISAGIAAAPSWPAAVTAALREVIERDALAGAWTFGLPLDPVELPGWLTTALGAGDGTRWTFHRLPTVVDVAGVLAVVRHEPSGVVGVGAAVRGDPVAAARKAAAEATVSAGAAIELDTAGSATTARHVAAGVLRPRRADRAYTRTYRADWHDVVDIACHLQLYLDPALQARLERRLAALSAGRPSVPLESLPTTTGEDAWWARLVDAGYQPVAVDITTTDVATLGWHVTRCVVPGVRSTAPAAFPFLADVPAAHRRGRGPVHPDPVPHA